MSIIIMIDSSIKRNHKLIGFELQSLCVFIEKCYNKVNKIWVLVHLYTVRKTDNNSGLISDALTTHPGE